MKDIQKLHPNTPALVITHSQEQDYIDRVFRDGARGFIQKPAGPEELVTAVRQVLDGKTYLAEEFKDRLLRHAFEPSRDGGKALSDREWEVFDMTGHGCSAVQIGRALGIRPRTVETYRSRLQNKLAMRDVVDLAAHAGQWVAGRIRWFMESSRSSRRK